MSAATLATTVLLAGPALAGEGMWLPQQLEEQGPRLQELGLQLPPRQLTDPKGNPLGAVVWLGHCSAAFVSPDGLIATNAHCVREGLQYASAGRGDLVRDGFVAGSKDDEAWAGPTARIFVPESITDVTDVIDKAVGRHKTDQLSWQAIERTRKKLVAECEAEPSRRCEVVEFNGGGSYSLVKRREIKDVRIAYAPPDSIGMFGGEVDNWMWPRHTGDFAFIRAYVGQDGSSRRWDAENVPYKPETWLSLSTAGVKEGDFVFLPGYPYRTFRYLTAAEIGHAASVTYPDTIALYDEVIEALKKHAESSDEARQKVEYFTFILANSKKSYEGMLDNFAASKLVEKKAQQEAALDAWVAEDKKRQKTYGADISELRSKVAADLANSRRDRIVSFTRYSPQLLTAARTGYRLSIERAKPDVERRPGYQDRDLERIENKLQQMESTLYLPAEKDVLEILLNRAVALPESQRIAPFDAFIEEYGGLERGLEHLFDDPPLAQTDNRLKLLQMSKADFESSEDPWIRLAVRMEVWSDQQQQVVEDFEGAMHRLRPGYLAALSEKDHRGYYADANGTLRVSYGTVEGYHPQEAVSYGPVTTLAGMAAKFGDPPFEPPAALLERITQAPKSPYKDKDLGNVPVCFLTSLDNTGGSSGSPTLNSKGELIGLVFDRNYEGMAADWQYVPGVTRSIHVDIRFALWMMDEVLPAKWIIEELDIKE